MSSTVTWTTTCDAPDGCPASYSRQLGEPAPEGWTHIPGRDSRRFYISRKPRDYCPGHAPAATS